MLPLSNQVIAVAGTSDLARYFIEELRVAAHEAKDTPPKIIVLTRGGPSSPWYTGNPHIILTTTDYTPSSVQAILDANNVTALFCFVHRVDGVMESLLTACRASRSCRRYVPGTFAGNIVDFPHLPRVYGPSQVIVNKMMETETEVECTVLNNGFLADYFVQGWNANPKELPYTEEEIPIDRTDTRMTVEDIDFSIPRSYMSPIGEIWPIDLDSFAATRLGTGTEPMTWTAARDVGRALVRLVQAPLGSWEKYTYVAGQVGTWNHAIEVLERFFERKFKITEKSVEEIMKSQMLETKEIDIAVRQAAIQEFIVAGAAAVPMEIVRRQREKFFLGLEFRGLEEVLRDGFRQSGGRMI